MKKKLKNYHSKLVVLILINIFFYLFLTNTEFLTSVFLQKNSKVLSTSLNLIDKTGLFLIASVIVFFLNYIFPSNIKYILVFKKFKYPLPGYRLFDKLIYEDSRINIDKAKNKYGTFPSEPKKQNTKWYEIYKKK